MSRAGAVTGVQVLILVFWPALTNAGSPSGCGRCTKSATKGRLWRSTADNRQGFSSPRYTRNASKWGRTVREVGGAMHRILAVVTLALLIACVSMGDASADTRAGHKSTSKARAVQSHSVHGTSARYHAIRGADDGKGTYYTQVKRDRSDWHQARRRASVSAPVPAATDHQG
jgi:hypothetical protein